MYTEYIDLLYPLSPRGVCFDFVKVLSLYEVSVKSLRVLGEETV
jgi:hypothetical protein